MTRRLQEYRAGKTTEPNPHQFKQMAVIAKHLSDEEIQSLANYLQGLHASADNATPAQIAAVRASGTLPAAPGLPAPIGAPQPVAAPAAAAPATEAAPAAEAPAAAPTH